MNHAVTARVLVNLVRGVRFTFGGKAAEANQGRGYGLGSRKFGKRPRDPEQVVASPAGPQPNEPWKALESNPDRIQRLDRKCTVDKDGGKHYEPSQYVQHGKPITDKKLIAALDALKIRPGLHNVVIDPDFKNATHQAFGLDDAGRKQPTYSAQRKSERAVEKFERCRNFTKELPKIRAAIRGAIDSKDPAEHQLGVVLDLIDKTTCRIGGKEDTGGEEQAYGATTLEARHVRVIGDVVKLRFVGKSGVKWSCDVKDADLARNVAAELKGKRSRDLVFPLTNRQKAAEFLSKHGDFTAKDFRTFHATRLARQEVQQAVSALPGSQKELKAIVASTCEKVSSLLNNTPSVAKKEYIDPAVWGPLYERGLKKA